jgi:hypothetical protein
MKRLILLCSLCWATAAMAAQTVLTYYMVGPGGSPVTYVFALPDDYVAAQRPISDPTGDLQHRAGVNALQWAKPFYQARDVYLLGVELKQAPAPYFLAKFNGDIGGQRQSFFAVILVSGVVIPPTELVLAQ